MDSFNFINKKISEWKSTGIFIYSNDSSMKGIEDIKTKLPELKNDGRMLVYLQGNHFQQNDIIILNNDNVINIYVVYKLDPMSSTRNTDYTIQNIIFGAMKITKNTDASIWEILIMVEAQLFLVFMKILLFIQIIKQIIFTLWVMDLYKELLILLYTQKKHIVKILLNQAKSSY